MVAVSRTKTIHRCAECGATAAKWSGRCASCGAWNTLVEEREAPPPARATAIAAVLPAEPAAPIGTVGWEDATPMPSGIAELDAVLGGGLVPGSVTLLGGEPGIGKSTLLLQLLARHAQQGRIGLLVSGEESRQQVRLRAERLGAVHDNLWLAAETSLPEIVAHIERVGPSLVVIDSVQTLSHPVFDSAPGSVTQVRECANELVKLAKRTGIAIVLVGHVTKEGGLAGPRALEHVVDTVLAFEGDRFHSLRLLRAVKHRFGATGELGLFDMREEGLCGVADPSQLFLADREPGAAGSVITVAMEGQRPLLLEVQALVTRSSLSMPRRNAQGLDAARLQMLVAVLSKRLHISMHEADVFASVVGGVRLVEPAADLSVALAMVSSGGGFAVPEGLVAFGEVGLAGEVRQVAHASRRLTEAARLGFRRALVPLSAPDVAGIELLRVRSLDDAVTLLQMSPRRSFGPRSSAASAPAGADRPASAIPRGLDIGELDECARLEARYGNRWAGDPDGINALDAPAGVDVLDDEYAHLTREARAVPYDGPDADPDDGPDAVVLRWPGS